MKKIISHNSISILLSVTCLLLLVPASFAQTLPNPSITITSPEDGGSYAIDPIEFLFNVERFVFVSYKNFSTLFPGKPNAGHAHLWISPPPAGATEDTVYEVESPDFHQLGELEPGGYDLTVELVRNDHSSFSPRVYETVSFRVTQKTAGGRYAIIKTDSSEAVGVPPPSFKPLRIIFLTALVFLLIGVVSYLKRKGKLTSSEVVRITEKFINLLVTPLEKLINLPKKIYSRIRRKK